MAPIDRLPFEILQNVCEYLDDEGLDEFAVANKRCCAAADATRYREVQLVVSTKAGLTSDLKHWNKTLGRRSCFRHVRRLIIQCLCIPPEVDTNIESVAERGESWHRCRQYTPMFEPDRDLPYCPFCPEALTPAEHDEEDEIWGPTAQFISKLSGLKDFFYLKKNQLPRCILNVLHQRLPRCRLHLRSFFLNSLVHQNKAIDEYGLALATSPNLYSICLKWIWLTEDLERSNAAAMQLVGALSPRIKEICVVRGHYSRPESLEEVESLPLRGPFTGLPRAAAIQPRILEKFAISQHDMTTPNFFQAWGRCIMFSQLRSLLLSGGVRVDTLAWLTRCTFDSLETLLINIYGPYYRADCATHKQIDEAASAFLRSLLPLKDLTIKGAFGQVTFKAILDRHGAALKRLAFQPTSSNTSVITLDMIEKIHQQCCELRDLSLPVQRYQGDAREVVYYQALSRLSHLEELWIYLDCSDHYTIPLPNTAANDAYFRDVLINCAVDYALVRSISSIVSQGKKGKTALQRLKVSTWGRGGISLYRPQPDNSWEYSQVLQDIGKGTWQCVRLERCSELIVEELDIVDPDSPPPPDEDDEELPLGPMEYHFRSLWPDRYGDSWQEDWYSFPLQLD